jgi:soluble lytic murein transglycosylase-like protein
VTQVDSAPNGAGHPPPAPLLSSERLQVLPRLEGQRAEAVVAVQLARQAAVPGAGGLEAAALAPALAPGAVSRATSPPAAPAAPAAPPPAAAAAQGFAGGSVQDIIVSAFTPYGAGAVQWGLRVARCESGYNPKAVNPAGPYYGLFQFLVSTFKATPYGGQNILDPVANSSAAAWKYSHSGSGAWGCK